MVEFHLAVFIPNLAGGGAERVIIILCKSFVAQGARVDLVLGKAEGPLVDQLGSQVTLLDLNARGPWSWIGPLANYLRSAKPDILLSAIPHANIAAILATKLARVPTMNIISEHTTISLVAQTSPRPLARALPFVMRIVYPHAKRIVAVSSGVADDLSDHIGIPRDRIDVIRNPVDIEHVSKESLAPLDHPWFTPTAPPVILTAGRLIPAKDHECLLEAFARLRRQRECRLVILGEGPQRERLQAQVSARKLSDDVLLPGFVLNPYNWMRRAAVFALSSRREGLPTVLVEAMVCGTPVVSTDCRHGPREILEGGKWGRLVPFGDAVALADAIATTLDEPVHRDVKVRAAAFNVGRAVEEYARLMGRHQAIEQAR